VAAEAANSTQPRSTATSDATVGLQAELNVARRNEEQLRGQLHTSHLAAGECEVAASQQRGLLHTADRAAASNEELVVALQANVCASCY
jgi:hypothetical protein